MRTSLPEVVMGLFGLMVYLLPAAITTVVLLKLFALSREVGEVKTLVINLKETIDRANQ